MSPDCPRFFFIDSVCKSIQNSFKLHRSIGRLVRHESEDSHFLVHIDIICFVFTKVLVKLSQAYTSPTGLQKGIEDWHLSRIEKNPQVKAKAKKMNLKHQLK